MIRLFVVCEGPTEETFVRDILAPHLARRQTYARPLLVPLKRRPVSRKHKGGMFNFGAPLAYLQDRVKEDSSAWFTTMFDYYALPGDFPGRSDPSLPPPTQLDERVDFLEAALARTVGGAGRLIPYLQVHEYEALLFSDVTVIDEALSALGAKSDQLDQLRSIESAFGCPEDINDHPDTAPSKRLKKLYPSYDKVVFGPLVAHDIGLPTLRARCPRFDRWVSELETLR